MSTRYDCLVCSPDGREVLLTRSDGGWSLPNVLCEQGWLADAVGAIRSQLRALHGIDVAVLREIQRTPSSIVCELEALSSATQLSESVWQGVQAPAVEALLPEQRAAVQRWSEDRGVERYVAPWQRRGWFEEARQWTAACVQRAGLEITGELTQVKAAWNGSCVLKVETSDGRLYFKASPPRRPGEPAVLRALSTHWSRHVPAVVGADEERCWTLMREIGGSALEPHEPEALADAARLIARIQIDQAAHVDRWAAMGCPDRGLGVMERRLERLLREIPRYLSDAGVLSATERDEIASLVPEAGLLCRRLGEFSVPPRSIHHEDFRAGNVCREPDGNLVVIDWNETVLAHPFFTAQRFLWFMDPPEGVPRHEIRESDDDALRRTVRDAYLEPFTAFESQSRLLEAFRFSSLLAPVYHALYFDASFDVDEVFRQGLDSQEAGIARGLMDQLLAVNHLLHRRR